MLNVPNDLKIMMLFLLFVLLIVDDSDDCLLEGAYIKNDSFSFVAPSAATSIHAHFLVDASTNSLVIC